MQLPEAAVPMQMAGTPVAAPHPIQGYIKLGVLAWVAPEERPVRGPDRRLA
jgi:hypothetical protein